jgi:nucleoside-diphosphate-sugar epimerase
VRELQRGNDNLKILIFGGAGFVGINIAAALLARGHRVTLFDRAALPRAAWQAFATYGDLLKLVRGDVTEPHSVENIIASGFDAIILGAAITAGPARDAADSQSILQVNLFAQLPILMAARRRGVARIINLSSAAAYGAAAFQHAMLDEETACDPVSLYAVTKYTSEKVAARLAALWQADIISVRLSGVFGPWERVTARHAKSTDPNDWSLAAGKRGDSLPSGFPGLDLCFRRRRCRDGAGGSGKAQTRPLQYLDRARMVGAAMGTGSRRSPSRLRLPVGQTRRSADGRSA